MKAVLILGFYITARFLFFQQLDALGSYASYIFEILFSITALFLYRKNVTWGFKKKFSLNQLLECLVAIGLGVLTYKTVVWQNIAIPFNFKSTELVVTMLMFGPVLEEILFRFALWYPFEELLKKGERTVLATALLFSFSHFFAYFFVPPLVVPFVLFQTLYTLLIGLWWGYRFLKSRSILIPIILHILFNLGFYLGYLSDEPTISALQ